MRPEILFKLFTPNKELPGVAPRINALLTNVAGAYIGDLLWLLPNNFIDRRFCPLIGEAPNGEICTFIATVIEHIPSPTRKRPYRVICSDESGLVELVYFNARKDYLQEILPINEKRIISGKVDVFNGRVQVMHPDHVVKEEDKALILTLEPVYPLTQGLTGKVLRRCIHDALKLTPNLPEWLDPNLVKQKQWMSWIDSLRAVHSPKTHGELIPTSNNRARLAYDELLANQLALAMIRRHQKKRKGRSIIGSGALKKIINKKLSFALTPNQLEVLEEINNDFQTENRMLRLLQGDVGSGKTIVAFYSILTAIEAGFQTALLAPTEILAKQHFQTLQPLAKATNIKIDILTGKMGSKERNQIISNTKSGSTQLLIGTHALFQDDVVFKNLGFAVVDEQHKFCLLYTSDAADE